MDPFLKVNMKTSNIVNSILGAVYIVRAQHRGEGGFSLAHPSTQGGRGGLGPAHVCIVWKRILEEKTSKNFLDNFL